MSNRPKNLTAADYEGIKYLLKYGIGIISCICIGQIITFNNELQKSWLETPQFTKIILCQMIGLLIIFKLGVKYSHYLSHKRGDEFSSYSNAFEDWYRKKEYPLFIFCVLALCAWYPTRIILLDLEAIHWLDFAILLPLGVPFFLDGRSYE